MSYLFWIFHTNEIIQHFTLCDWLLSFRIIFKDSFIYQSFLLLYSWIIFLVWIDHILLMHSSVDWHLCFSTFQLLKIMNIWIQIFVWTHAFIFPGYKLRTGTAGSYLNLGFNLLRNYQMVSPKDWLHHLPVMYELSEFVHILVST